MTVVDPSRFRIDKILGEFMVELYNATPVGILVTLKY